MRILMINKFLYPRGGAETYLFKLGGYLESLGHDVEYFGMAHPENTAHNRVGSYTKNMDFHGGSFLEKLGYGLRVVYSMETRRKLRRVLEDFRPEVCHLNNFNYQLTPSILLEIRKWSRESGNPCRIVYTAHDYQLVCPNHMCYDPGKGTPCEKCLQGDFGNCVRGRCIHNSLPRSILGALESAFWHRTGIYRELDAILCCSRFLKEKLDTNPIFREKTQVLRNFTDPAVPREGSAGDYVLYFGRYSGEKGISLLAQAARELPHIPFVFAGAGALDGKLAGIPNVRNAGFQTGEALTKLIRGARFTVCPSVWYENCPFSVLESLAQGVPVLGADIGGIPELIQPGRTGQLFQPGNLDALKNALLDMWLHPMGIPERKDTMTLDAYTRRLLKIYHPAPLVTVVVPVYNTAPFLNRCVESLVHQTYRNLEILLIDDGSPDECPGICDDWAAKDSRIRVIHKENAGLGMARNTGIENAAGDYICFVDSDDYLLPRTIEMACCLILRESAEVAVFGVAEESASGKRKYRNIKTKTFVYRETEVQNTFLPKLLRQEGNLPISSCTGLYSMALVRKHQWRFPSERQILSEDVYALLNLYGVVERVAVLPEALYVYCENPNSLTRSYRADRYGKIREFYRSCITLCEDRSYSDVVTISCGEPFLGFTMGCMKQEISCHDRECGRNRVREILNDPLLQQVLGRRERNHTGLKKQLLLNSMAGKQAAFCYWLLAGQNWLKGAGK